VSGKDDELITLEGGEPPGRPVRSEAQLAAALVMQAQALDGMRRAHSELLARIDQGPERQALLVALQDLREATERVQAEQSRFTRRQARARRRLAWLGAALLLLAAGATAAASLAAWQLGSVPPATRAELDASLAGQQEQWRATLEQSRADQSASLSALTARLDHDELALRDRLDQATAGRDEALRELQAAHEQAEALQQRQDELQAQAARERDLRLGDLGEMARLREQVMDGEQRLADLTRTLTELHPAPVAPRAPGIVTTAATAGLLARQVTGALRASGAAEVSVLELGAVRDGVLHDLLVMLADPDGGPGRVLRVGWGELVAENGSAGLQLLDLVAADGSLAPPELVALPALDRPAWERLGVAVPAGAVAIGRLATALSALVEPHGWRVAGLRGYDGEALVGLRLDQLDVNGAVTRTLRAEHGVVLPGPELELSGGTLTVAGDERPFFGNVFRLPLPGGDFGAWLAAVRAETP
jgi:hypothetical protein